MVDDTHLYWGHAALCVLFHRSALLPITSLVLQGCLIRRLNLLRYLQPISTPHWYTIIVFSPSFVSSLLCGIWSGGSFSFQTDAQTLERCYGHCIKSLKRKPIMNFYRLISDSGGTITFEGDGTKQAFLAHRLTSSDCNQHCKNSTGSSLNGTLSIRFTDISINSNTQHNAV